MNTRENTTKCHKCLKFAAYLFSYVIVLFWGTAIVKWQVPPYGVYVWAKQVLGFPRYEGPFAEISSNFAFIGPLADAENQIEPAARNMEQVEARLKKMEIPVSKFPNAYESLSISHASFLRANVFRLDFDLGLNYTAYSYFEKSLSESTNTALLLIPGSGFNQSSAMLPGGVRNYHDGLYDVAKKYGDVYLYIKPNEDIRAIHNGRHKLDYNFITNTLISHGGSYSAYYIVETMAITKFLQQKYRQVIVAGVSQGGAAASLNAFQSWPSAVLCISGGYYPSKSFVIEASPYNIMIPGLNDFFNPISIPDLIMNHQTRWLYALGKLDIGGFRVIAEENILFKYFQGIHQVTINKHNGGHVVPVQIVDNYLNKLLSQS